MSQEQENYNLKEKRQSTNAHTEMNEILEFSENNFKAAIVPLVAAVPDDSRHHQTPTVSQNFTGTTHSSKVALAQTVQQQQVTAGDLGN